MTTKSLIQTAVIGLAALLGTVAWAEPAAASNLWGAFTKDLDLYVGIPGSGKEKRITDRHRDFKPSWSPDGEWIVFFRLQNELKQDISRWKTALCVVKPDGSELRQLTSGAFADFNPTWMRDGSGRIVINRFDPKKNRSMIYLTTVDSKPGEEYPVSDLNESEWCHSCAKDGRMVVTTSRNDSETRTYLLASEPDADGYFRPPYVRMLTPRRGRAGDYVPLRFTYKLTALPSRLTLSPSETKITYELDASWDKPSYDGHPLVKADIDLATLTVSREVVYSVPPKDVGDLYPAWTPDESQIVFFSNRSGRYRFYRCDLASMDNIPMTPDSSSEYLYFCAKGAPK